MDERARKPIKWSIDRVDGSAPRALCSDAPISRRGYPMRADVPEDARARMVTMRNRWFGRSMIAGAVALAGCGGATATTQTETTTPASTTAASCEPQCTSTGTTVPPPTVVQSEPPADARVPEEEPAQLGGVPPSPNDD